MLVFLDTEYTDTLRRDLISIGMIGEDGQQELYAERSDYRSEWCNSFTRAAVLPLLGKAGPALNRQQLAVLLAAWFAILPRSVTIACDCHTDWELLIGAMSSEAPTNLSGRYDLSCLIDSPVFHQAAVRYSARCGLWHHALYKARAQRYGWLAWQDSQK